MKYWVDSGLTVAAVVFLGVVGLASASCSPEPKQDPLGDSGEAIVEELKRLRSDLAVMREAITDIHRRTMTQPAGGGTSAPAVRPVAATELGLAGVQSIGSPEAPVGIVEFADFQCPYCARHHAQTFPALKREYVDTGKARYFFRNYPLAFHPEARPAAIAANCAARQDAFLPIYEELFANTRSLGPELYVQAAAGEQLDQDAFARCLNDRRAADEVDNELLYAQSLGVTGTPTFFIGRIEGDKLVDARRLVGAQSGGSFSSIIEAQLASAGDG